ncbi:MAG: serine protease [Elusimicrobiota bacterium]
METVAAGDLFPAKIMKIVGGLDAVHGEFPFIVSLQSPGGHFCGGSLIRKNWVLTAGHCVRDGVKYVVITGLYDQKQQAGTESFPTTEVIHHPNRVNRDYDFALLRLDGESKFSPVSLNRRELSGKADLVTAGWGDIAETGGAVDLLQKVTVPLVSAERCSVAYPGQITDRMICAGFDEGGKDSCQGDSGGPLLLGSGAETTLVGVVSWGEGCARPNKYGVYAKVNSVLDWIDAIAK